MDSILWMCSFTVSYKAVPLSKSQKTAQWNLKQSQWLVIFFDIDCCVADFHHISAEVSSWQSTCRTDSTDSIHSYMVFNELPINECDTVWPNSCIVCHFGFHTLNDTRGYSTCLLQPSVPQARLKLSGRRSPDAKDNVSICKCWDRLAGGTEVQRVWDVAQ